MYLCRLTRAALLSALIVLPPSLSPISGDLLAAAEAAQANLEQVAVSNPPQEAVTGNSFRVTDTVKNTGGAPTGVVSTTQYYLSKDARKGPGDILLQGSRDVPDLGPGSRSTAPAPVTVRIPLTTPLGTYFLLACADDTGVVPESDETEASNCEPGGQVQVVDISVSQDKNLWFFGGENPRSFRDGAIEVTLTAQGALHGTFTWEVTDGKDKVDFENDKDTITKTTNTVKVKSTAASDAIADVTILLFFNGLLVDFTELEVRAPNRLRQISNRDFPLRVNAGWLSLIKYEIQNQFLEPVKNVGINETFGEEKNFQNNDWPIFPAGGVFSDDKGTFSDNIFITGDIRPFNPRPLPPGRDLSTQPIDKIVQKWFVGSTIPGKGVQVQTNDHTRFIDHGRHLNITTP